MIYGFLIASIQIIGLIVLCSIVCIHHQIIIGQGFTFCTTAHILRADLSDMIHVCNAKGCKTLSTESAYRTREIHFLKISSILILISLHLCCLILCQRILPDDRFSIIDTQAFGRNKVCDLSAFYGDGLAHQNCLFILLTCTLYCRCCILIQFFFRSIRSDIGSACQHQRIHTAHIHSRILSVDDNGTAVFLIRWITFKSHCRRGSISIIFFRQGCLASTSGKSQVICNISLTI